MSKPDKRVSKALDIAFQSGGTDGEHHKAWVIDQMVRALTGCPYDRKTDSFSTCPAYREWVANRMDGEDGPATYVWDEGIAP